MIVLLADNRSGSSGIDSCGGGGDNHGGAVVMRVGSAGSDDHIVDRLLKTDLDLVIFEDVCACMCVCVRVCLWETSEPLKLDFFICIFLLP